MNLKELTEEIITYTINPQIDLAIYNIIRTVSFYLNVNLIYYKYIYDCHVSLSENIEPFKLITVHNRKELLEYNGEIIGEITWNETHVNFKPTKTTI